MKLNKHMHACIHVELLQLCLTLCDSMDCSPPSSSVHGILPQEYWNGFPWLPPGDLPDPGIKPTVLMPPALAGRFCITSATQESQNNHVSISRIMASLVTQMVRNLSACRRPGFDPWVERILEKGMATHSSILVWRIPWTEEPGELLHGITTSWT